MKQRTLAFLGLIAILSATLVAADEVARFESELSSEFVVRDGSIVSTSTARGKAFIYDEPVSVSNSYSFLEE